MKKLLGVDLGEKKTGIAVSDESRLIAFAHSVIKIDIIDIPLRLQSLLSELNCEEIIIGIPKRETQWKKQIIETANNLKSLDIVVHFEDEDLTSALASIAVKELRTHGNVNSRSHEKDDDAQSARIILQRYLDKNC